MVERHVIDTLEEYHAAIATLRDGTGPLAVDAERASGYRYSQRAYLIQVYRRGAGTFLFDPPAIGRLDELNAALCQEEWILHAASQDLPCLREVGLDPLTVFDTELSCRLLGLPKVGLGTVVEDLLGVHLAKQHSAADWSTRPLPQAWLDYAALDVELLVDLREHVGELLRLAGKEDIARQEFEAELHQPPKPPRAEPWRRLSGVHSVKGRRGLAVARALWHARDDLAREQDISPSKLVPDASLVVVAKSLPRTRDALAGLREFTGRASRTELTRWWAALEEGLATDDLPDPRSHSHDTLPPARSWRDKKPEANARLTEARSRLRELSEELSIPLENLLTPEYLRRLAWAPPAGRDEVTLRATLQEMGAREWQLQATVPTIAAAFVDADQTMLHDEDPTS